MNTYRLSYTLAMVWQCGYCRLLWFMLFLLGVEIGQAQRVDEQAQMRGRALLEQRVESLVGQGLVTPDVADRLVDQYDQLCLAPMDINVVQLEDLMTLPLMNEYLAYQFIRYRTEHAGRITSLYDLKRIEGWDDDILALYFPLLYCDSEMSVDMPSLTHLIDRGRWRADMVGSFPVGAPKREDYIGSPESLSLRWHWHAQGRLSAMLAAHKDSYEPWQWHTHRGFDSYSGHVALQRTGVVRRLVLGDYRVHWAEGLLIRQGLWRRSLLGEFGRVAQGIRPVTLPTETDFGRGAAVELRLGRWSLSAIGSRRWLDGRVDSVNQLVTALSETGLRRTERDWMRRHTVPFGYLGAQIAYTHRRLSLSLSTLTGQWGGYRLRHATGASSIEALDSMGRYHLISLGYHYQGRRGNAFVSGEIARSQLGGWATVQRFGWQAEALGLCQVALRYIDDRYWSYLGRSHTHALRPSNELGLTLAVSLPSVVPRVDLGGEVELYRAPRAESRSAERSGFRMNALAIYRLSEGQRFTLTSSLVRLPRAGQRQRYRLSYEAVGRRGSCTGEVSLSHAWGVRSKPSEPLSYAIGLRGGYAPATWLHLRASVHYHHVTDWLNRLYLAEARLSHLWRSTFAYGHGLRSRLVLSARLSQRLTLGLSAMYHHVFRSRRYGEVALVVAYIPRIE